MYEKELKILLENINKGYFDIPITESRIMCLKGLSTITYGDFCKIPVMTKEDIRKTSIKARELDCDDRIGVFSSSGSTGKRTYYTFSREDRSVFDKNARKLLGNIGICSKDIFAVCAPIGEGIMAHTMMWEAEANGAAYTVCPEPSPTNVIEILQDVPVTIVAGLPSVMDFSLFDKPGSRKDSSALRMMLTGGHYLSEAKRKRIESVWGIDWFNAYGMSEFFGPLMCECCNKDGFHYDSDLFLMEILDSATKEPVTEAGATGVLVITPLWKKGSPLIRYWTDDYVQWIGEECSCGFGGRRIRYLGRMYDMLYLNGRYIFPSQIEEILIRHGARCLFIDEDKDGGLICYLERWDDDLQKDLASFLGVQLSFRISDDFENLRRPKPVYFSEAVKRRCSDAA